MYQVIPSHSRLGALLRNAPRFKFAPSFHPSSILCQLQRTHTNALDINTLSIVCCVCYTWFRAWIALKLSSNLALRHALSRFHHSALSVPHTLSSHTHTHQHLTTLHRRARLWCTPASSASSICLCVHIHSIALLPSSHTPTSTDTSADSNLKFNRHVVAVVIVVIVVRLLIECIQ